MNKLSYGILSLLSTEPLTGYDITMRINKFWRSTHSAIYPLLSELEQKSLIELTLVTQCGKPDKKIYNLTILGKKMLHDWFTSETAESVVRDEMNLKLYCIKCMDTESAQKLLNELEARYKRKIEERKDSIERIKARFKDDPESANSLFGGFVLNQRALSESILDLKWCEWVRDLYERKDFSFLEEDFNLERNTD